MPQRRPRGRAPIQGKRGAWVLTLGLQGWAPVQRLGRTLPTGVGFCTSQGQEAAPRKESSPTRYTKALHASETVLLCSFTLECHLLYLQGWILMPALPVVLLMPVRTNSCLLWSSPASAFILFLSSYQIDREMDGGGEAHRHTHTPMSLSFQLHHASFQDRASAFIPAAPGPDTVWAP